MTDEGENLWRENVEIIPSSTEESDFNDTDSVDRVWNDTQAELKKKANQPEILAPDSDPEDINIEADGPSHKIMEIEVSEKPDPKSRKIDWNTKSSAKNLQRAQYRRNQEDSVQA